MHKVGERNIQETYDFKNGDMFEIPRDIVHSFYFKKHTTLVSMYSNGVELSDGGMDILVEKLYGREYDIFLCYIRISFTCNYFSVGNRV